MPPSRSECPPAGVHPEAWGGWLAGESQQLDRSVSRTLVRREMLVSGPAWEPDPPQSHSPAGPGPGPSACLAVTRTHVSSRASSSESLSAKTCSLFLPNYVQDKYLLQLLRSADDVSNWVAAEIVTSHTSKVGASAALSSEQGLGSDGTASGPPAGAGGSQGRGFAGPAPGRQMVQPSSCPLLALTASAISSFLL